MYISRILYSILILLDETIDIYLSRQLPGGIKRHFPRLKARDTALHSSKDLAVAPPVLPLELILPFSRSFSAFASKRLCSHLADYSVWVLPITLAPPCVGTKCSDFPPCPINPKGVDLEQSVYPTQDPAILAHFYRKSTRRLVWLGRFG